MIRNTLQRLAGSRPASDRAAAKWRTCFVRRLASVFALAWVTCVAAGCVSLDQRVSELVEQGEYEVALQELRRAGVAPEIREKAKPESVEARRRYQVAVEDHVSARVKTALDAGQGREALAEADRGLELCQWSDDLTDLRDERRRLVDDLDRIEARALDLANDAETDDIRAYLSDWRSSESRELRDLSGDSPNLRQATTSLETRLIDRVSLELTTLLPGSARESSAALAGDLQLAGIKASDAHAAASLISILNTHPEGRSDGVFF